MSKEKNIKHLERKIAAENELLDNFEKYGISQRKIDKLTAKRDRHDKKLKEEKLK